MIWLVTAMPSAGRGWRGTSVDAPTWLLAVLLGARALGAPDDGAVSIRAWAPGELDHDDPPVDAYYNRAAGDWELMVIGIPAGGPHA